MRRTWIYFLLGGIVLGSLGFAGGYLIHSPTPTKPVVESCDTLYPHINDELRCKENPFIISKASYLVLRTSLTLYIQQLQRDKVIDNAAVFFRDLKDGPTFDINASESFIPASLLKLPTLITFLRLQDENPKILEQKVFYTNTDPPILQAYPPQDVLISGKEYTIDELLTQMIVYSDNTAYSVLFNYLKQSKAINELLTTYHELGLILPQQQFDASITTKNYASLFRILYTSSYISRTSSEKALTLLVKSTYKDALVAGVPSNIQVAHKFGERFDDKSPLKELHDCGIVYFPGNPYSLCVMTKGTDFAKLELAIKTISQRVYEEVARRKLDK